MQESVETRAPQYLSFDVADTGYGLPILAVKEILQFEEPTRVPGAPASVRGVINVRGAVVPVLDLAVKFGEGETAPTKRTCILVVETRAGVERLTLGVLADAVSEVLDLPPDAVEPPPAFGTGVRLDYLTGMGKVGKGFVLLLDVDRVVSASEADLVAQAAAVAAAPPPDVVAAVAAQAPDGEAAPVESARAS
ncbi:MAG TPA: chemotaxis protein CheW [Anaeromyxobacter sp.]|nr:chemotaxis protein CheW [Anaeromyxobacter sp.]